MRFFSKRIIITKHAKKRYRERISNISDEQIQKNILNDFEIKNIKKKTVKNEKGYFKLLVKGNREYTIIEKKNSLVIVTIIAKGGKAKNDRR